MAITLDGTNGVTTPDFTVDTTTITVNPSTNRVGIGTASPNNPLEIAHTGSVGAGGLRIGDPSTIASDTGIYLRTTGDAVIGAAGGNIVFDSNMAVQEDMRIDSSGRVTKPNQPSFSARGQDANWRAVPGGIGWSTIAGTNYSNTTGNYQQGTNFTTSGHYGAENVGNHFTNASGHFTAPIAGHYYFSIRMYLNRSNTNSPGIYINPRINNLATDGSGAGIQGSYHLERTTMSNSNNAYIPFGRHDVYKMAANDTFTYGLQAEAAGFQIYGQYTEFKGYLIG